MDSCPKVLQSKSVFSTKMIHYLIVFLIVEVNSQDEFPTFRLENYVQPNHYDLLLDMFISDQYYMGTVDITLTSEQEIPASTRKIELNSKGLNIDSYSVKLMKSDKIVKLGAIIEQDYMEKFIILLQEDLEIGTIYRLHVEFTGNFAIDEDVGLLLRSFTNEKNETSEYVAASLFPLFAHAVFPCFDEPHLKATFNLTLTHPSNMKGLSTMPLLQTNYGINVKGEQIIWSIFQQTPRISPSSIGIFLSNMECQASNSIAICASSKHQAQQISCLPQFEYFHSLMQSLTLIHLQIPLNFVFIPDLQVETFQSFGIIYVRSNDLEHELNVSSIVANIMRNSDPMIVELAKQVAAQYFGHMISPKWWTDIWLTDSLSQFYGLLMACKFEEACSHKDLIPVMLRNQVFDHRFETSRIVGENFNNSKQLIQSLSQSRTNKGVFLLFMLSNTFGESTIFQGVSSYLKKFFLGSATTRDLIREWENQIKSNNITLPYNSTLEKMLQPWLKSKYEPILNVTRIQETTYSTIIISQFNTTNMEDHVDWYIPLHYLSAKDTGYTTKVEKWLGPHMEDGEIKFEVKIQNVSGMDDWIVFNPEALDLCRVVYDPTNWKLLFNQLKTSPTEIPITGRSQLIADAFSLARDGIGPYSNALDLVQYLVNETSFLPWHSAFVAFEELDLRLHRNEKLYKSFQTYVRQLVDVIYEKLGFEIITTNASSEKEDYLKILLRSETMKWACKYGNEDCADKAISTVKLYLAGNITMIQDEYMDAIFCGGLSQADDDTWNKAYNQLINASNARKSLIKGLACSKNEHLIDSYLNKTLTEDISTENAMHTFKEIYKIHYNYEKVLHFLEMNTGSIQKKYGVETFNKILIGVSTYASTKKHIKQLNRILFQVVASEELLIALNQTQRFVQKLNTWMIRNEHNLNIYFNDKFPPTIIEKDSATGINGNILLLLGLLLLIAANNYWKL